MSRTISSAISPELTQCPRRGQKLPRSSGLSILPWAVRRYASCCNLSVHTRLTFVPRWCFPRTGALPFFLLPQTKTSPTVSSRPLSTRIAALNLSPPGYPHSSPRPPYPEPSQGCSRLGSSTWTASGTAPAGPGFSSSKASSPSCSAFSHSSSSLTHRHMPGS